MFSLQLLSLQDSIYEGSTMFENFLDEGGSCVTWKVGSNMS